MNPEQIFNIFGILSTTAVFVLGGFILYKVEQERRLMDEVEKLRKSLEEMDEQAKLVVRTDLELNKTQEELDKKVTGLYALQQFSKTLSTTLEENQIFLAVKDAYLEDLSFEKAVAFLWSEEEKIFMLRMHINYSDADLESIKAFVEQNKTAFQDLIRNQKAVSSISPLDASLGKDKLNRALKVSSFVIAPLWPKEGSKGFLAVGTEKSDLPLTEGDEEFIVILATQLSQALENARLFEKSWRAQQDLHKRVEERTHALSSALEEVNKVSQRKTDFVSSVSHELRTPLTSIKGYASLLLTGKLGMIPEEVRLRLEKINKHSDELVQLVNNLLDISRIESGRVSMKLETQDLRKITEEVVDLLAVQAKEKLIELSYTIPDDAMLVSADHNQLQRVLINIVNNAIKYTPSPGKIKVHSHTLNSHVQINITDTGYGIPAEVQERIFEEFYRVDNTVNQQIRGTGLGLALVKHIIEAHKGKIWVKSTIGAGSTFSFTLPRAT